MKRFAIFAVLCLSLSCALADEIMFSGNEDGRWIARAYRLDNADMFDIYHTSEGRPFEPLLQQIKGKLAAIQTVGRTLRVIYNERSCAIIGENGTLLTTSNLPGKFMAMCESPADPASQDELMVLVARPDCSRELAAASVQVKPDEWWCLYTSYGLEFKPVPARTGLTETKLGATRASMVQSGGKIYVLLFSSRGASLVTWSAFEDWKKFPPFKETPHDILSIDDTIFLVYPRKVVNNANLELRMAKLSPEGKVGALMPVVDPLTREALAWDADTKMTVSSLGQVAGICWKDRTKWDFLTVDEKARAGKTMTVDDLLRASSRMQRVEEVQQYFMIAIITAGFVVMFLLKPYVTTPRLLVLPPGLKPANMLKRVVAIIVDLMIVQIPIGIAANYFIINVRNIPRDEIMDMLKDDPQRIVEACPELLYFGMAFVVIFAIYGTAMEMMCGWTVGKRIMGLRVVTDDAIKPPLREAALRNIFKIVALVSISPASDMVWYFILLVIVMFVTRYRQRIGDLVARTIVVEAALPAEQQQPQPPMQDN
ncbi:MAG TPA: RDD family protein [Phycisphaerae bacterium]|nr:RDD family protein [Phycisphaerae bacterium]